MTGLVHEAGLRFRSSERGSWDGATDAGNFQDLLVLQFAENAQARAAARRRAG